MSSLPTSLASVPDVLEQGKAENKEHLGFSDSQTTDDIIFLDITPFKKRM